MGAQVLEPGGFSAGRSPLRDGVDSYDVLLAAHARATQVLPDGPLLAIGGDCGADLGPAAQALRRHDGELAIVWIDAHADFNTPASSPSGAFHGMVLRSLTGIGPAAYAGACGRRAGAVVQLRDPQVRECRGLAGASSAAARAALAQRRADPIKRAPWRWPGSTSGAAQQ